MAPLLTTVSDPAAWLAEDMADESAWTVVLTAEHIAEIDKALESTKNEEIFQLTKQGFSLPTVSKLLRGMLNDLEGGRGFVRIRGLPVESWGEEKSRRALWGLGKHLGWGEVQDKAGSLIHDVKDTGRKFGQNGKDTSVRLFQTNQEIPFHTDGCDIFALMCLSAGAKGGRSKLMSAVSAFNEIVRRRPDLAAVLQEDFHFDARGQHPDGKLCQVHPVYTYHEGKISILHKVPYIMSAQNLEGVPKLTAKQKEALDTLDSLMEEKRFVLQYDMQPGDCVLCSNHSLVHGRTAFEDVPQETENITKPRHMLRLWLSIPNGRQLPPHYAGTREYVDTYNRRMRTPLKRSAADDVTVMDGSIGRLLMNRGVPQDPIIWSGRSIVEEKYHEHVIQAHKDYINAGAAAITTNNYTVQPAYYRKAFGDSWKAQMIKDTETAAKLACQARSECLAGRTVSVMGCLPPICESHRPDLAAEFFKAEGASAITGWYTEIAEALLRGGPVDAFQLETMNTWDEANCAIQAVRNLGKPIILSMEGGLRSHDLTPQPQLAPDIAQKLLRLKEQAVPIEVLSFNCAPPEDILACLDALEISGDKDRLQEAGIQLGVYANLQDRKKVLDGKSKTKFSAESSKDDAAKKEKNGIKVREDLKDEGYLPFMHKFIRRGCSYVGGCCGSTPEQIQVFTESLMDDGTDASGRKRRRLEAYLSVTPSNKGFCGA